MGNILWIPSHISRRMKGVRPNCWSAHIAGQPAKLSLVGYDIAELWLADTDHVIIILASHWLTLTQDTPPWPRSAQSDQDTWGETETVFCISESRPEWHLLQDHVEGTGSHEGGIHHRVRPEKSRTKSLYSIHFHWPFYPHNSNVVLCFPLTVFILMHG